MDPQTQTPPTQTPPAEQPAPSQPTDPGMQVPAAGSQPAKPAGKMPMWQMVAIGAAVVVVLGVLLYMFM
ncbi:hypothetical protein A3D14_01570 [Candidatus Saccharibacteria bacterium RIFCSPHIGHO2_02_FULL_47_12]|nr:MAG: hypothetical protein A3D14_01570 [Candidatus Saccharibacteria bacterium RIFCSPHIGHO2_02_FULL_47_12]